MAEISEDGFWQLVNEEWIPTQKQLDAIDSGAIPHEKALTEQSGEEVEDLGYFDSKPPHETLLTHNSNMNTCAACGNEFEGKNARNCPGRKCRNPICLDCDPLDTSFQKKIGLVGTVVDVVTGDLASLVDDKVKGGLNISRVRCKQCVKRDQREDVMLISALLSFIFAFLLLAIMKLFLPFNAFILYLLAYSISFYILMRLLYKFYSLHLKYIAPLRKIPSKFKNIITIATGAVGATIFISLLIGSGTDYSDNAIVGEWYSTVETFEFQSDGDVIHSDSSVVGWRVQDGDLLLQLAENEEYEYYFKYQISNEFLFIAPYEADLRTVSDNDCVVLSGDANATNQSYWDVVILNPPAWCNV